MVQAGRAVDDFIESLVNIIYIEKKKNLSFLSKLKYKL